MSSFEGKECQDGENFSYLSHIAREEQYEINVEIENCVKNVDQTQKRGNNVKIKENVGEILAVCSR